MTECEKILRDLDQAYTEPIRDPVWQHISLSPPLLKLVALEAFQKLNGIKQLGPTYLVYPGATHTRLNHSLGVFHIAKRMITALLTRTELGNCTLMGVKAFLCAALLHDLGHYPFAHSLKDLRITSHEELTAQRIMEKDFSEVIAKDVGADPSLVAAIIDSDHNYSGGEDAGFFSNLLSGVLDPDKLDYLNRDAYFCGVPYGIQDVDFVLEEIHTHNEQGLAITRKGLAAVESILFSKYLMYRTVYWHKTVRIATAMIKKVLLMALTSGILRTESLYWLDDQEFLLCTRKKKYPPFRLIEDVACRKLYKLVFRIPFDSGNAGHSRLMDLGERLKLEQELAGAAGRLIGRKVASEEVIIDIPEPISFEIDLPVLDPDNGSFSAFKHSGSVFSAEVVKGFTSSLRFISIICSRDQELISALLKIGSHKIIPKGV